NVRYSTFADETSREDNYFFIRPALFYNFASWGSAGLSYEHRRNDSDRTFSNFTDNQTTVQIGIQY
ncbi:MAG: hypothetical protein M3032_02845, partial [Verrucomicrobiota bacterium]|nr:hypothetical protein [Verrucomicrobiota bacterium]